MQDIAARLEGRTVFIAGSEKNAGKTTFLNFALNLLRGPAEKASAGKNGLAFMSTGVDGESRDMVFGNPKPRVFAAPGELVVTAQSALAASDAQCRILAAFPSRTVLGRMMLARVLRGGNIEITAPESNSHTSAIIARLRGEFGARTILVDGAASRFTQVASVDGAGFVYVLRAERARMRQAADALRLLLEFSRTPSGAVAGGEGVCRVIGAFTAEKLAALPRGAHTVVIEDCTKVFLTPLQWRQFAARRKPVFEKTFALIFAVVNLYDISRGEFESLLDGFPPDKLLFNPYQDFDR